jgi:phage terminase Nu1 subunit (DNA packaging protein)
MVGEVSVPKSTKEPALLQGWKQIAAFLGQPLSVAQRWAKSGMPVIRNGRRVHASPDELNRWLGRESSGEPVHIATESENLAADLKRGLSYVLKRARLQNEKAK